MKESVLRQLRALAQGKEVEKEVEKGTGKGSGTASTGLVGTILGAGSETGFTIEAPDTFEASHAGLEMAMQILVVKQEQVPLR